MRLSRHIELASKSSSIALALHTLHYRALSNIVHFHLISISSSNSTLAEIMTSSGLNYYLIYCPFIMLASAYKSLHKKSSLQDSNSGGGGDVNTPYSPTPTTNSKNHVCSHVYADKKVKGKGKEIISG